MCWRLTRQEQKFAEEIEGVHVERFRYFKPDRAQDVCYSGGALFNVAALGQAAKVPALVGAQWAAVRSRVSGGSYDIVSAHWLLPQGWTAVRASKGGPPVVSTVHGSDVFGLGHPVFTRFKRSALKGSAAVTVNSTATQAAVADLAPDHPDVRIVPMGSDVHARAAPDLVSHWREFPARTGPLLVFVGRLIEWKGAEDLVEAVARLRRRCRTFRWSSPAPDPWRALSPPGSKRLVWRIEFTLSDGSHVTMCALCKRRPMSSSSRHASLRTARERRKAVRR